MPLTLVDDPLDRPAWIAETIRLLADGTDRGRRRLLRRVEAATDAELAAGSTDDGARPGRAHLLVVERAVALIGLRLAAAGRRSDRTAPARGEATRASLAVLAAKAEAGIAPETSSRPCRTTRRRPGTPTRELNCFGWLLLPNHYRAHLTAPSAADPARSDLTAGGDMADRNADRAAEALATEDRRFRPPRRSRRRRTPDRSLYEHAERDFEGFWAEQARTLTGGSPSRKVLVGGALREVVRRRQLNVAENCLDRHVRAGRGARVAYHWEGEPGDARTVTYADLLALTNRCANALGELGVRTGDRVRSTCR